MGSSPTERATSPLLTWMREKLRRVSIEVGGRVAQRQSSGFISHWSRVRIPPLPPPNLLPHDQFGLMHARNSLQSLRPISASLAWQASRALQDLSPTAPVL